MKKRNIAILGSTGSIGTQALDVVRAFPELLEVSVLTASANHEALIAQAREFKPNAVVIVQEESYLLVKQALADLEIVVYAGRNALEEVVEREEIDMVLNAIVGSAGLRPTVRAIEYGKDVALANKETLVVAGALIMELVRKKQVSMWPVDSEHSAIFQCLVGESANRIEKIYLTASGGPFRGKDSRFLSTVTKQQALKHPNWVMGAKITIDSATLMNKGLEVIEAKWLFDLDVEQIDVIVHPQSIVHSIVQFEDGSMKAQMGLPDMKLPIQYALTYPQRRPNSFERFNFMDYGSLTFEPADSNTFRNLELAYQSIREGGDRPCVLNAANEVAVAAFLAEKVSFLGMSDLIEATMCQQRKVEQPTMDDLLAIDEETRIVARSLIR
ncbi:1-deoxy-D-xylulose 5-phosphate reductoisomerase [Sphingobacterium allocomposti]|uniref:1-deoxy-D-xylulose 5-phosphate reductoisomerase n=1 Tax=Sphingobacterium allocomposti TaxID=415956 RepID=A0A5S5DEV3_9SPHI|nr:1-deoxy-D-xylulose-5-phosphate reductoisomerase [Sphingobacterium composti Yoo et al. 2007 non Ten et al. 2007]TYP93132.1 1-deoxy-D-xylulose 5-phosphate reductoisomerase [Sphingobacterium composti Yoo et al. 2007 non Ten et al. 2007]